MADQAASLFSSGCFKPGDLKVTMGTGTFLNVNTGREPHASVAGNFGNLYYSFYAKIFCLIYQYVVYIIKYITCVCRVNNNKL